MQVVNLARKEADKTVIRATTREMLLHILVLYADVIVIRYLHTKTKDITSRRIYKTHFRAWATDQN